MYHYSKKYSKAFFLQKKNVHEKALFDTGSSCIELPDASIGNLEASPFRALLDAHMRYGQQMLEFDIYDNRCVCVCV